MSATMPLTLPCEHRTSWSLQNPQIRSLSPINSIEKLIRQARPPTARTRTAETVHLSSGTFAAVGAAEQYNT